jgi:hypothetical protein
MLVTGAAQNLAINVVFKCMQVNKQPIAIRYAKRQRILVSRTISVHQRAN